MTSLHEVPLPDLQALFRAVVDGRVAFPLKRSELQASGLGRHADAILGALGELDATSAAIALRLVIAEREHHPAAHPDLVWTGPEPPGSTTRDTAVVVRDLFEQARRSVLVGGYSFDHGAEILEPLHRAMVERGVSARLFLDVEGRASSAAECEAFAVAQIDRFLARNWPFGPPLPEIYYDPRTVSPDLYASLHAKCIVVDDATAFVTSANFTLRAQSRNIEVGALIRDAGFARQLAGHWNHLVGVGLMVPYKG